LRIGEGKGESIYIRGVAPLSNSPLYFRYLHKGRLRGAKPLFLSLPLAFEGEGDTGGEVRSQEGRQCQKRK